MTNVLMPTLVGNKLLISQYMMDTNCRRIQPFGLVRHALWHGGGGATLRVLGRQLPLPPPP